MSLGNPLSPAQEQLPPVAVQPRFAITSQVCACGCDIRLPVTIVNRGWRYLRNHKPKAPAIAGKPRRPSSALAGPVKNTSMFDVLGFLKAQQQTLLDQEAEAAALLATLDDQRQQLIRKINTITEHRQKVTEALAQLGSVPAGRTL